MDHFNHHYMLPSTNANIRFDMDQNSISFIYTSSQKLQFLTNIEPEFDHCFSLAVCNSSTIENISCKHTVPKVSLLPSASAEQLIGATPFRLLNIESNESFDTLGIIQHCTIKESKETQFIQSYATSNQPMLYSNNVWGMFNDMLSYIGSI